MGLVNKKNIKKMNNKYDVALIGTSPVFMLEALYQSKSGKSVLMIDNSSEIGGAWKSLNLFGISNIENAVHYLLEDKKCAQFLENKLHLSLRRTKGKVRIIQFFGIILKLKYDSILSRLLGIFFQNNTFPEKLLLIKSSLKKKRSLYLKKGSHDLVSRLAKLIKKNNINVLLKNEINLIDLSKKSIILLRTKNNIITVDNLFISNGSFLPTIKFKNNTLNVENKYKPRPAMHILLYDTKITHKECIFENDTLIKYVHDITHYSDLKDKKRYGKRVLVFALKTHIKYSDKLPQELIKKLIKVGILSTKAKIIDKKWHDIVLPPLEDSTLEMIYDKSNGRIKNLKTDTLSSALGFNSSRWSEKIDFSE